MTYQIREIQDHRGRVLARVDAEGECLCALCPVRIQRTSSGDLPDGVRAHYRTVHPERKPT